MSKQNSTKKQHYIPREYLDGFADDNSLISYYDLYKQDYIPANLTKRQCYENYLYEFKDNANNIILLNHIEHGFQAIESPYKDKIKAIKENGYRIIEEEKPYWILYIAMQILRMPSTIDLIEQYITPSLPKSDNLNHTRNVALRITFPFFRELEINCPDFKILEEFCQRLIDMDICVAHDDHKRLFTSDFPIYLETTDNPSKTYKSVVFPLNSELCILMNRLDENRKQKRDSIEIDDKVYKYIFYATVRASEKKLYTSRRFTDEELKWIKMIQAEKE